jgi:rubredoxin/uncharacterized membrane protein
MWHLAAPAGILKPDSQGYPMSKWKCSVCGYEAFNKSAPVECPVCGVDQTKFTNEEASAPSPSPGHLEQEPQKQWKCLVCGYIHTGPEPPEVCPVCGADKSKFILVETEPAPKEAQRLTSMPAQDKPTENAGGSGPQQSEPQTRPIIFRLLDPTGFITRLHGHPIAVHIPNGVLPLSVLFTLIAVGFKSDGFAAAASYNMVFVALSIPVVIISGFIDWYHRFDARWAKIFRIKFICGIIVGTFSLIIAGIWFAQPTIHRQFSLGLIFFLVLNLINFVTAAVAGYYGGKLVFKQ